MFKVEATLLGDSAVQQDPSDLKVVRQKHRDDPEPDRLSNQHANSIVGHLFRFTIPCTELQRRAVISP